MGTKISEFIDLTSNEVETNKEHIWIPTYVDQAVRDNNNFRIKVSDIKGNGGSGNGISLIASSSNNYPISGAEHRTPFCIWFDNLNYDVVFGTLNDDTSQSFAIIPIFTGDAYKNGDTIASSWGFVTDSEHKDKYVLTTKSSDFTYGIHFEAPANKKLIAIGIKGTGTATTPNFSSYVLFGLNKGV